MLNNILFSRTSIPDIEKAMDVYSARQKVLSNNVANAMTPGYEARTVTFEEEYQKAIQGKNLEGRTTNGNHIELGHKRFEKLNPEVEFRSAPMNDTGLNNVDIDKEMAEMAETNLRYEMATSLVMKKFANIKSAIRGR